MKRSISKEIFQKEYFHNLEREEALFYLMIETLADCWGIITDDCFLISMQIGKYYNKQEIEKLIKQLEEKGMIERIEDVYFLTHFHENQKIRYFRKPVCKLSDKIIQSAKQSIYDKEGLNNYQMCLQLTNSIDDNDISQFSHPIDTQEEAKKELTSSQVATEKVSISTQTETNKQLISHSKTSRVGNNKGGGGDNENFKQSLTPPGGFLEVIDLWNKEERLIKSVISDYEKQKLLDMSMLDAYKDISPKRFVYIVKNSKFLAKYTLNYIIKYHSKDFVKDEFAKGLHFIKQYEQERTTFNDREIAGIINLVRKEKPIRAEFEQKILDKIKSLNKPFLVKDKDYRRTVIYHELLQFVKECQK